jgi:C1A family cysteine protease
MHHLKFGWKPDLPDHRDLTYKVNKLKVEKPVKLPKKVDLRTSGFMPPIMDQGELGSCTSFAISSALEFDRRKQKLKVFTPSHLFIYYNEREMEGTVDQDAGAEIRDGIKSVSSVGYCDEAIWPYDVSKFTVKPVPNCYTQAKKNKAVSYFRIDNTDIKQLKACLAAGFPFVFGATVYKSFYDADNAGGIVPMPTANDQVLGGHAILCVGYDDSTKLFCIHNSWGTEAGDNGYYYIPYDYMTNNNLCDDFWTVRSTT